MKHITCISSNKMKFLKKNSLVQHPESNIHLCHFCWKVFSDKSQLQLHLTTDHSGEGSLRCKICKMSSLTKENVKVHMRVHTTKDNSRENPQSSFPQWVLTVRKPHSCKLQFEAEGKTVQNEKSCCQIDNSQNLEHSSGEKPTAVQEDKKEIFHCQMCGEIFSSYDALSLHIKSHKQRKPYECNICGRQYTYKSYFKRHKLIHAGNTPFVCGLCGKCFALKEHLTGHNQCHTEDAWKCNACGKCFSVKKFLRQHKCVLEKTYHYCKFCCKTFCNKYTLKNHVQRFHTEKKKYMTRSRPLVTQAKKIVARCKKSKGKISSKGKKLHKCDTCSRLFSQVGHLKRHMLIHTRKKLFVCDICDKSFALRDYLLDHMRLHVNDSLKCDVCGKCFKRKRFLDEHKHLHTGERLHSCKFCTKAFSYESGLKMHVMRFHTKDKPFSCHVCKKRFVEKYRVKRHLLMHLKYKLVL